MLAALPHTLLLVATVAALSGAALRVASTLVPRGLTRTLVVVVLVAATAAAEALIVGWVGLGMSPYALSGAAALTWLGVRLTLPSPDVGISEDARDGWRALTRPQRVVLGGVAGAWVAWTVWGVARPVLGHDMIVYHLPEAIAWVQDGNPGALMTLLIGLPVEAYPGLDELIAAWAVAVGRTMVPFSVLPMISVAVLAASVWVGLRSLVVTRLAAGLATGAICFVPTVLGWQLNGAPNDPAALAWVSACAALCAASRRRAHLLAPALVAAGLAIGCKPPAALPAALVLGIAMFVHRHELRALARLLAGGALVGGLVGLFWYARNFVEYGSPLWPWIATPWGDPAFPGLAESTRFVERPVATIEALEAYWRDQFVGPLLLFAGSILAVALRPSRKVVACTAAAAFGVASWAVAPATGIEVLPVATFSSTRYLLPAIAAATVAIALVATSGGWRGGAALLVLGSACAFGVLQTLSLNGFAPNPLIPLVGAIVGAAAGAVGTAGRLAPPPLAPAGALAVTLSLAVALAAGTTGYTARHARSTDIFYADVIRWLLAETEFQRDARPVLAGPLSRAGILAGDRLEHDVAPILPREPDCTRIDAAMRAGYVVTQVAPTDRAGEIAAACIRGRAPAFSGETYRVDTVR